MEEFKKALESKDCQKVLECLDDYLEIIESEEDLRELLQRLEELALECEEAYGLAHEITHILELERKLGESKPR